MKNSLFIFVILITGFSVVYANPPASNINQAINDVEDGENNIHTILLHRKGWELSYPVISLHGDDKLLLSFDDLGEETRHFTYRLVHCNADWQPSNLFPNDYMEGFEQNPIDDYRYSTNTTVPYIHYKLEIPNDNVRIILSGNYLLQVYDGGQKLFEKRFFVVDSQIEVNAECFRPKNPKYSDSHQEINVTVPISSLALDDPTQQIKLNVYQNGRWDISTENLTFSTFRGDYLLFQDLSELTFPGGSEFRIFDCKNLEFNSKGIRSIEFKAPNYNIYLTPDDISKNATYFYHEDINGKRLIKNERGNESAIDGDYVKVHFEAPLDLPLMDESIFVEGSFSGWKNNETYKMTFGLEERAYIVTLFLKQGYYNYTYTLRPSEGIQNEGYNLNNFYETENDYLIFIYQLDYSRNFDRLIGYKVINSLRD